MVTSDRLNAVIEYIEKHITEELELDVLAGIACSSRYDFQRMFMFMANMPITEYIRKRRMTLAGFDLRDNGMSVMEAALKYRYSSPVSFARAFKALHGINPGAAKSENAVLNIFNRLEFQNAAKEVPHEEKRRTVSLAGIEYQALYLGEREFNLKQDGYFKRVFWRVENPKSIFQTAEMLPYVLPYDNYPVGNIEQGQVFVIDYYKKDGSTESKYYVANGAMWRGMQVTTEFLPEPMPPIRVDVIRVGDREFEAEYFGVQDMSRWSERWVKREFRRLRGAYDYITEIYCYTGDVLPINQYPPIGVREGQAIAIDYYTKDGDVQRRYYLANGTIWHDLPSTAEYAAKPEFNMKGRIK